MKATYIGNDKKKTQLSKDDYVITDTFIDVKGSGGGKGGGGASAPRLLRDTFRSNAIAKVILAYSVGETGGLVNGAKSIFLDGTPLQQSDGTYNFQGVSWEERVGTVDQTVVKGFEQTTNVRDISAPIEYGTPIVTALTSSDYDSCRVIILVPGLVEYSDNGDQNAASIDLKFEVWNPETQIWINRGTKTITGKSSSAFEIQYYVEGPGAYDPSFGNWQVRVTRLTADSTSDKLQNASTLYRLVEVYESTETYPGVAYVALTVDVALFGNSIPNISLEVSGTEVRVPSNYYEERLVDGATLAAYDGPWDGTFKYSSTSNPAWHLYNLAINTKYGAEISIDYLDKYAFYDIAKYCDAVNTSGVFVGIDDGNSGVRRRFTLNTQITQNQDALKMLQDLASSFRGMLYYGAGAVIPSQDSPKSVSAIITNENVLNGRFVYSSADAKSRYTVATIAYSDKDDFYRQAYTTYPETSEWATDPNIARFGRNVYRGTKFGCNNEAEAYAFAKWIVYSSLNETEMVSFTVGPEHSILRPGEVVEVYDRRFTKERFGGRLASYPGAQSKGQVRLDNPVTLASGQTYELTIVTSDGTTIETRDIDMSSTATNVPTINIFTETDFTDFPVTNYTWAIKGTDISPRKFRILNNEKKTVLEYEVTAMYYDENKYAAVEQGIYLEDQQYDRRGLRDVQPPTNIQFETRGFLDDTGNLLNRLVVKWTRSTSEYVNKYRVRYRRNGDEWHDAGITEFTSMNIDNALPGIWDVLVYSRNIIDLESIAAEAQYELIYNGTGVILAAPILDDVTEV